MFPTEDPYFNAFVVAALCFPLVVGALASSWQRAFLWIVAVLGVGWAFEEFRDWWLGRQDPSDLLKLETSQILFVIASAVPIYGTLAVIGYGLKRLVWRRSASGS